jgi:hypothetical protein
MKFISFLIPMLLLAFNVQAYKIKFSWEQNPEPLTGYTLYFKENTTPIIPFNCEGLNNNKPKTVSKTTAHNPDAVIFNPVEEGRGYIEIDGVSPYKEYSFALTAYVDGECTPEKELTKYREDGSPYCESDYSDIVTVGIQAAPTIKTLLLRL